MYIDTINLMATPDGQTPANWANGIADFDGFDPKKCLEKVEAAYKNTHLELDMAKAVADADLVIESMAENVEDKISFYQKLAPLMPAKTVLVTNSSTLLPSNSPSTPGVPTSTCRCTSRTPFGRTTLRKLWRKARPTRRFSTR